jgi:hypothetical protein
VIGKLDFEARMAFMQAGMNARAFGDPKVSLPMMAAAFASAPSIATAVLDLDALLRDLGARPVSEVDFGTNPGGFVVPLDERAASAFTALELEIASEAEESVRPARVLLALAAADPDLQAILDRNDLTEDVLRAMSS